MVPDDPTLLHEYVAHGSHRAFADLVGRHADLVYSAALRRVGGDPHRAREVAQQVFIDFAHKAPRLVRHPLLAGWLHASTRWAAANQQRSERRRQRAELAAGVDPALHPAPIAAAERNAAWAQVAPWLDAALDGLREADREAVLLRFFQDQSYAAIATRFGCSENTARMRVERALERLRHRLTRRGVTSSAVALGVVLGQHAVSAAPAGMAGALTNGALNGATAVGSGLLAAILGGAVAHLPAALAALVTVVLAWGLVEARANVRQHQSELAALQERRATAEARVAALDKRRETLSRTLRSLPAANTLPVPTPLQRERRQLDVIVRKGELDVEYAALFLRLKLPPATLDRLKTLLVDRNQAIYDALQVAKAEGVDPDATDRRALAREATRGIDAEIALAIGQEAAATVARYEDNKEFLLRLLPASLALDAARNEAVDTLLARHRDALLAYVTEREYVELGDDPPPLPAAFVEARDALLDEKERVAWQRGEVYSRHAQAQMRILREAALAGKLKLDAKTAKIYRDAAAQKGATP